MSRDKKRRHDRDHDDHARERPASTDIADVIEDDSAKAASDHQRRKATAGPSEDDRYGEGAKQDVHGRIIGLSIVGGRTQIMIGLGKDQGVHAGMEGYLQAGDGMAADFQIHESRDRVSLAMVDLIPDEVQQHLHVVVNPTTMPKSAEPKEDMSARVIGISVEGGRTKILLGRGIRHGVRWGMRGYLKGSGSHSFADFEIVEAHPGHSVAYVTDTVDAVRAHTDAVINPANMPG